jgi:hypothetical protein
MVEKQIKNELRRVNILCDTLILQTDTKIFKQGLIVFSLDEQQQYKNNTSGINQKY